MRNSLSVIASVNTERRRATIVVVILGAFFIAIGTGCRGPEKMPSFDVIPGSRGAVVVLTGIENDKREQDYATSTFTDFVNREFKDALRAKTFPWFLSCGRYRGIDCVYLDDDRNRARARNNARRGELFAKGIRQWKENNPKKELYIVAVSGGGWLLHLACKATDADGDYIISKNDIHRVVLVSTILEDDTPLVNIARATNGPIYSCYSRRDGFLRGTIVKLAVSRAAGTYGFSSHALREGDRHAPLVYELEALGTDKKPDGNRGNRGGHCGALATEYSREFLKPILEKDAPAQPHKSWRLLK